MPKTVLFDEQAVKPTGRFCRAIKEVMLAEIEMMREQGEHPSCWRWGVATIDNLSSSTGISFMYGGDDDGPEGYATDESKFQVIVIAP